MSGEATPPTLILRILEALTEYHAFDEGFRGALAELGRNDGRLLARSLGLRGAGVQEAATAVLRKRGIPVRVTSLRGRGGEEDAVYFVEVYGLEWEVPGLPAPGCPYTQGLVRGAVEHATGCPADVRELLQRPGSPGARAMQLQGGGRLAVPGKVGPPPIGGE